MTAPGSTDQRVVVVTGGGAGIGAAVAEQLGAAGCFVVTVDPLVTLDGSAQLPAAEETTAGRITAAGGAARASATSVTDRDAIDELFTGLVEEFGRLDAVVNVAGITRPTSFTRGTEEDWLGVLSVHLDGYLNVLRAALPIMAAAGYGHILGVTSGSGWRAADTGAYGCAKRAVASLTWQLGRMAPAGVVVNAMSPIAATRMVTAALGRAAKPGGTSATGGLSLGSMPAPDDIGPIGAHLVGAAFDACRGQVIFAGGSELAVVDEPRLLEVVRTDGVTDLAQVLDAVGPGALAVAEAAQASAGGSNPRFPTAFRPDGSALADSVASTCAVVADRPEVAAAVAAALAERGVTCRHLDAGLAASDIAAAGTALAELEADGPIDGLVVVLARPDALRGTTWETAVEDHSALVPELYADAAWCRAAADRTASTEHQLRVVTLTDATSPGGRSRAQAAAQLARSAVTATGGRVVAFAVSEEADDARSAAQLAAHLLCHPDAASLSGAELVVGSGWLGVRSHPRPGTGIVLDSATVPTWFDHALSEIVR